jgi:predicted AAA+ superfamily ATPase
MSAEPGDSFLLATFSSHDTARARVAPRKDRKFSWIDPALGSLAYHLGQGDLPSAASRAEWLVGAELLRRYERRLFEGLSAPRNVFTWKSSSGNELDYLIVDRAKKILFPVEVKYQNSISDWDFQVAEKAFGRGLIVSKTAEVVREKAQAVGMSSFLFESDGVLPAG